MDEALAEVRAGDKQAAATALTTVQKIVNNILKEQKEPKFRRLRMENKAISDKVLSVSGGRSLLLAIGFQQHEGELVLPMEVSPVKLLQARVSIDGAVAMLNAPVLAAVAAALPPTAPPPAAAPVPAIEAMDVDDPAPSDADPELAAALALSMENDGLRPTPAPAPAPAPPAASSQEALKVRVREIFLELTAAGLDPNSAAAKALQQAQQEASQAAPAPPSEEPPAILDRAGLEARVKQLFAAEVAAGTAPNDAAAKALKRAQTEQLAAAAAERRRAAAAAAAAAEPARSETGGASDAATPPVVHEQSSSGATVESVGFVRWEEVEQVASEQLEIINELYRTEGFSFIDPSFPPHSTKSLYASEESATTWRCRGCSRRNPLPPTPTEQEALKLMFDPEERERTISCPSCGHAMHLIETTSRPTGWRRPLTGELGLRDHVTMQFSSVPWVVFRGDPRPEDIFQGGVGNCWLVCAMSCLAETPELIRKVVLTPDFNPAGAYQVRLCHAGEWKIVTVDDVFPTNAINCLAYLRAARRQLWGVLIEKACAKLHGSYEALEGGTFEEAFSMLTGMPVQRIRLGRYQPPPPPDAGASPADVAAHAKQREKWEKLKLDTTELFAQLFSFKQAGFAIGASTFMLDKNKEAEARAKGLQIPHAYCVLALTEVDGECLIKLRNPNGHAGWRGDWSRDSARWTYDTKQEVGLDKEDGGVFWMSWEEFCSYFAELAVCRLLPDHLEARERGWLSSAFNAGQALSLEVFAHTRLELAVHQEPHIKRGEMSFATLLDVGLVVLKQTRDAGWQLVAEAERTLKPQACLQVTLEQDDLTSRYLAIPLCFSQLQSTAPRKFVVSSHSTQPLSIETVALPSAQLGTAMIQLCLQHGERQRLLGSEALGDALVVYVREEEGGYVIMAENLAPLPLRVELDASERTHGFLSSRGALFCQDILPPRSRQLLIVLSVDMSRKSHSLSLGWGGGSVEPGTATAGHIPELDQLGELKGLHLPQPMDGPGGGGALAAAQPAGGNVDVAALAGSILANMQRQQQQGGNQPPR